MQPSENSENSKYNLAPVVNDTGTETNDQESGEKQISQPEVSKQPAFSSPSNYITQVTDAKVPVISTSNTSSVATTTSSDDNPAVAEDNDLIEKEWVAKAKQIIEDNREDPHKQSNEITTFKSDYMIKRYNKVVKPSE